MLAGALSRFALGRFGAPVFVTHPSCLFGFAGVRSASFRFVGARYASFGFVLLIVAYDSLRPVSGANRVFWPCFLVEGSGVPPEIRCLRSKTRMPIQQGGQIDIRRYARSLSIVLPGGAALRTNIVQNRPSGKGPVLAVHPETCRGANPCPHLSFPSVKPAATILRPCSISIVSFTAPIHRSIRYGPSPPSMPCWAGQG